MAPPIITLTTDFGLRDAYVAAMKGVILRLAPAAMIVDITHEVAPQDIEEAAYTLAQACRWYPAGTIHVVVVDPGVGTARRPLLASAGGHYFIAPDNGVLSFALERAVTEDGAGMMSAIHEVLRGGEIQVRHCTKPDFWLSQRSRTFHGRDIFAPMAAWLARGVEPGRFGEVIQDYRRLEPPRPQAAADRVRGTILHQDRFGNLITNLSPQDLDWRMEAPQSWRGHAGSAEIRELRDCYAEAPRGQVFAIWGSAGWLELSAAGESAAEMTGLRRGDTVEFLRRPAG